MVVRVVLKKWAFVFKLAKNVHLKQTLHTCKIYMHYHYFIFWKKQYVSRTLNTLRNRQQGSSSKTRCICEENNANVTAVGSQCLGDVVVRTPDVHEQLAVAA